MKFNNLTLIRETKKVNHARHGLFLCDCGEQVEVRIASVTSGLTKSCGCLRRVSREKKVEMPYKPDNLLKIYLTDAPETFKYTFGVVVRVDKDGMPVVRYRDLSSEPLGSFSRFVFEKEVVKLGRFAEHKEKPWASSGQ